MTSEQDAGTLRLLLASHTSLMSGAERSLIEFARVAANRCHVSAAVPDGGLALALEEIGLPVARIPAVERGFGGGIRDRTTTAATLLRTGTALRRQARATRAQVVLANSSRAGLAASVARRLGGPPIAVCLRDRLPGDRGGRAVASLLARHADLLIANSRHTRDSFPSDSRARVEVVYPPIGEPAGGASGSAQWRARTGIPHDAFAVGIVGQISPWKGHDVALGAVGELRRSGIDAHLAVIGEVKFTGASRTHDNVAFANALRDRAGQHDLAGHVTFTGEIDEVGTAMAAMDVVVVPSWSEPFGRTIVEAGFVGTPVVVTSEGGPPEIVQHGVSGLIAPPRDAAVWVKYLAELARDPSRRLALAAAAREGSMRFDPTTHAATVFGLLHGIGRPD